MSPKKNKTKVAHKEKNAAHKEKMAARKEAATTAAALAVIPPFENKPPRDHWILAHSYELMPAVRHLGVPQSEGSLIVPHDKIVELLMDEREAMIDLEEYESTKQLKEALEAARDAATAGISRHFRKASVHVHPDRTDLYLTEFDNLKQSYEILKDPEVREDYITFMLGQYLIWEANLEVRAIDNFFEKSHQTWIQTWETKKEQDTAHFRYERMAAEARNQRAQDVLFVEAAIHGRPPGHAYVKNNDPANRKVVLCLVASDMEEFFKVAQVVVVQAHPTGDEEAVIEMARLKRPELEELLTEAKKEERCAIEVPLTFGEHCEWNIQWHAILNIPDLEKPQVTTASTRKVCVDMTHPALNRCMREYPWLLSFCKRRASELRVFLQKLQAKGSRNPQVLEEESWRLHCLISKGRSAGRRLHTCLEVLGLSVRNCKNLTELTAVCDEAIHAKSILDRHVFAGQRKNTLKSFKQSVAAVIERGELSDWIKTVKSSDLTNHGGEVNRLYQIMIEGKKANSLLVDANALQNASARTDLFSEKQCQALKDRAADVDLQMAEETERLVAEDKCKREEAAARFRLEERCKGMPHWGALVEMFGLQKRHDLNGSMGYYMGVNPASDDRYIVKLLDDLEVSLKKDNFRLCEELESVKLPTPVQEVPVPSRQPKISEQTAVQTNHQQQKTSRVSTITKSSLSRKKASSQSSLSVAPNKPLAPLVPPSRPETTWILKCQVNEFIGYHGSKVSKMASETKTAIRVQHDEKCVTRDGREWVLVEVERAGKVNNIEKTIRTIDNWVKKRDPNRKPSKPATAPAASVVTRKLRAPSVSGKVAHGPATKSSFSYLETVKNSGSSWAPENQVDNRKNQQTVTKTPFHPDEATQQPPTTRPPEQGNTPVQTQPVLSHPKEAEPPKSSEHGTETTAAMMSPISLSSIPDKSASPYSASENRAHRKDHSPEEVATNPAPLSLSPANPVGQLNAPPGIRMPQSTTLFPTMENQGGHQNPPPGIGLPQSASLFPAVEKPSGHTNLSPGILNSTSASLFPTMENNAGQQNLPPGMMNPPLTTLFSAFGIGGAPDGHDCMRDPLVFHHEALVSPLSAPDSGLELMGFLESNAASLKTTTRAFYDYLSSMDIETLKDLAEAVGDDDVLEDFVLHGLKKFKKGAFLKAALSACNTESGQPTKPSRVSAPTVPLAENTMIPRAQNGLALGTLHKPATPDELLCPISFHLMTRDPVVAADGRTYERESITAWFQRNQSSATPILSPITGEVLANLELTPNVTMRNMAREHERQLMGIF